VKQPRIILSALGALSATFLAYALHAEEPVPAPPPIAITHGKVYLPGGRPPIDDGTVIIERGKIVSVGKNGTPPPGAHTIDARGKIVTPGLIDADTAVGVIDIDLEPASNDTDVRGFLTPALRMVDGYNPRSAIIPIARAAGITSVVVSPDHGVLGGQSAFADLAGDEEAEAIVRPALAQNAFLDDGMAQWSTGTRGGMWLMLREALEDARFYSTHRAQYDSNGARPLSLSRAGLEALVPVVKGEQILVVETHRASDIEAALRLADELKIKIVLSGASEAWMVADELARRRMPVIINPLENLPSRFDRLHSRSDNAAILSRAGVSVIIATYAAHQSRLLWQHAGNAVRMGMDHDEAIRAVTENPATAFGLKGYGRLEAGAVANVVVWSGDPLQIGSRPEHVLVHGREQSLETRQSLLLDRYRTLPVPRDGSR
jgi:imidazolonepropionase-like amidohydrolase